MTSSVSTTDEDFLAAGSASYPAFKAGAVCQDIKEFYLDSLGINLDDKTGEIIDSKHPVASNIFTKKACPSSDVTTCAASELVDWAFRCTERDPITNECKTSVRLPTNIAFDEINFGLGLAVMPPVIPGNAYQYLSTSSVSSIPPAIPFGYISTGKAADGTVAAPTDGAAFVERLDQPQFPIDTFYHIGNHDLCISTTKNSNAGFDPNNKGGSYPKRYNFSVISRPIEAHDEKSTKSAAEAAKKPDAPLSVKPFFGLNDYKIAAEVTPAMVTAGSHLFINGIAVSVLKNEESWNRFLVLASIDRSGEEDEPLKGYDREGTIIMPIMMRDFVYTTENINHTGDDRSQITAVGCRKFDRPEEADPKTHGLGGVALATMRGNGTWYAVSDCKRIFICEIMTAPPPETPTVEEISEIFKDENPSITYRPSPDANADTNPNKIGYTPILTSKSISIIENYKEDGDLPNYSRELYLFGSGSMSATGERIVIGATNPIENSGRAPTLASGGAVLRPRGRRQAPPLMNTILTYDATYSSNDHEKTAPIFKLVAIIQVSETSAVKIRYASLSASGHVLTIAKQKLLAASSKSHSIIGIEYDVYAISTLIDQTSIRRKWIRVANFNKVALTETYMGTASPKELNFYNPYTLSPASAPNDNIYTPMCISATGRRVATILAFGPASKAVGIGDFGIDTNDPKSATFSAGKIYVDIVVWTYVSDHLDQSKTYDNGIWVQRIERAAYTSIGNYSSAPVGVRFLDSTGGIVGVDVVAMAPTSTKPRATAVIAVKSGDGGVDASKMLDFGWNIGPHVGAQTIL